MRLAEVIEVLDAAYPPRLAQSWDSVGLVCGDPADEVESVTIAVDATAAVVDAVPDGGLLLAHHPLLLRGVDTVAADTAKGALVHRLIRSGRALFTAHTNADSPAGGVSESLALALGLTGVRPLEADARPPVDKIVVFAPAGSADAVRAAISEAGAGRIGDYDQASFSAPGEGRFRPLAGADPAVGEVGRAETVEEVRIESVMPRSSREAVVAAMLRVHPYEEPAYDVIELAALDEPDRGSGRVGTLPEAITLREFAEHVSRTLPATAHGVRVAGDPDQRVESVGLCGGAGDFLLDRARAAGVDVNLTSDLRHHPASELREHAAGTGAPALVDVAHWAAESTWLPVLQRRLAAALGVTVEVDISPLNTDPWAFTVPGRV